MKRRMNVRSPSHQCVTVKLWLDRAVVGELRDVSFDGTCLVPVDHPLKTRFSQRVRVRVTGTPTPDGAPLELPARVVSVRDDGVILVFEVYGEAVNAYLEHLYDEQLTRASEAVSFWHRWATQPWALLWAWPLPCVFGVLPFGTLPDSLPVELTPYEGNEVGEHGPR